jgi:hypothetical protein
MYAYFIDDKACSRGNRDIDRLDMLLTQHGISGRKIFLNRVSDLMGVVKECVSSGIKNLVAVGADSTFSRLLNVVAEVDNQKLFEVISIGFVPLCGQCKIAKFFGISDMLSSVKILSKCRIKKIDLGKLNNRHYFIGAAVFPKNASISFGNYKISSLRMNHHVSVCNMNIYDLNRLPVLKERAFDPSDGKLEAVIAYEPKPSFWSRFMGSKNIENYFVESVFPVEKILITSKQKIIKIMADTQKQLSTPVLVEVSPKCLGVILK